MKPVLYLFIGLLILTGCASKRYTKKGAKYEVAGYYDKAAEMYLLAVKKNSKNVEAQIGLKKAGQLALYQFLDDFQKFYQTDNTREAVYAFVKADDWYNRTQQVGCLLDFPSSHRDDFAEVKKIYLRNRYNEAADLLAREEFANAELIFTEILTLDPAYNDVASLKKTAHYEPVYRKALDDFKNSKYRSAYNGFNTIVTEVGQYKEASVYKDKALEQALITIAVLSFTNQSHEQKIETYLRGAIIKSLLELNSPFIKVVDRDVSEVIKAEQLRTLEGKVDGTISAQAGKTLGVKAFLTASVDQYSVINSGIIKEPTKAFVKEKYVETVKGQEVEKVKYIKTTYTRCSQNIEIQCRFRYQLISAETGAVLIADVITLTRTDEVKYAEYNGSTEKLVPGNWSSEKGQEELMEVQDSEQAVKALKNEFKARKQLRTQTELYSDIQSEITKQVSQKILKYDPEK